MVANNATNCPATMLATYVDEFFADRWSEAGATLAVAETCEPVAITLVPLIGHPAEGLGTVRIGPCVAACITSFGSVVRLDVPSKEHLPVRATVAVACGTTASILRYEDGNVQHADGTDGTLAELLREWTSRCWESSPASAEATRQ